jgi:C1A family cysteine protease
VGLATNDELPQGAPQAAGGGYFIVKNSWSNCFGDAGCPYLDWDYVKAVGGAGFNVSAN